MKTALLVHNTNAGDGKMNRKALTHLLADAGYKCLYASTKTKDWKEIPPEADIIVIAGGDGTVRKVAKTLLKRPLLEARIPIGLLPMGTANNISKSLNITGTPKDIIASWQQHNMKRYDVGSITGSADESFFLEGFGFGIFPNLINEMKHYEDAETPKKQIKQALKVLHKTIKNYKARRCQLTIDGADHSGNFLLAEIMNIRSIGPNLELNPHSDTGDSEFEVVLIPEDQLEKLMVYMEDKINGKDTASGFSVLKAKNISIKWDGVHAHVDDRIIKVKDAAFNVAVRPGLLDFLVA